MVWGLFYCFYVRYAFILNDFWAHNELAKLVFEPEMAETNFLAQALIYPIYHILTKLTAYFVGLNYAMASAIVIATANTLSIVLFGKLIHYITKSDSLQNRLFSDFVSFGGVFFVTARCWLNDWRFYQFQGAANPIHNPTTLMVRPFGILAVLCFGMFLSKYEQGSKYIKELMLCIFIMLLSVFAKPSFAFVFLPAMAIVVIALIIQHKDYKFGGVIGILGLIFIIMFLALFKKLGSVSALLDNVKFQFGSFSGFNLEEVAKVSIVTFPVPIILISFKLFRANSIYRVSMLALIIGWMQMFCLTNGMSGDFSWGYDLAVQTATIVALACTRTYKIAKSRKILAYSVYAYQVFCGIQYLMLAYQRGDFWF